MYILWILSSEDEKQPRIDLVKHAKNLTPAGEYLARRRRRSKNRYFEVQCRKSAH